MATQVVVFQGGCIVVDPVEVALLNHQRGSRIDGESMVIELDDFGFLLQLGVYKLPINGPRILKDRNDTSRQES